MNHINLCWQNLGGRKCGSLRKGPRKLGKQDQCVGKVPHHCGPTLHGFPTHEVTKRCKDQDGGKCPPPVMDLALLRLCVLHRGKVWLYGHHFLPQMKIKCRSHMLSWGWVGWRLFWCNTLCNSSYCLCYCM